MQNAFNPPQQARPAPYNIQWGGGWVLLRPQETWRQDRWPPGRYLFWDQRWSRKLGRPWRSREIGRPWRIRALRGPWRIRGLCGPWRIRGLCGLWWIKGLRGLWRVAPPTTKQTFYWGDSSTGGTREARTPGGAREAREHLGGAREAHTLGGRSGEVDSRERSGGAVSMGALGRCGL